MELEGPPEHVTNTPERIGGSRPPLDDGDDDSVTVERCMSARYTNFFAQLNAAGQAGAVLESSCKIEVTNREELMLLGSWTGGDHGR